MSRTDEYDGDEKPPAPGSGRRSTMKSLSALVDENRVRSGTMPDRTESTGPRARTTGEPTDPEGADDTRPVADKPDIDDTQNGVASPPVTTPPPEPDRADPDGNSGSAQLSAHRDPAVVDLPAEDLPTEHDQTEPGVGDDSDETRSTDDGGLGDDVGSSASEAHEALSTDPDDHDVDRSGMGSAVTHSGLSGLLSLSRDHDPSADRAVGASHSLARRILDEEISPGGRLSNPDDIPGIVLTLAKELPAAAAVSVVRVSEEVQLVGNTIDPDFDPATLTSVFSAVFRTIQLVGGVFDDGPLGRVNDVVIEGEYMDLVFRPLGTHYYLMVLEDRRIPEADLAETRRKMATLAPGLAAILAYDEGQI